MTSLAREDFFHISLKKWSSNAIFRQGRTYFPHSYDQLSHVLRPRQGKRWKSSAGASDFHLFPCLSLRTGMIDQTRGETIRRLSHYTIHALYSTQIV